MLLLLCVCVCGGCVQGSPPDNLRRTPFRRTAQNFALFLPSPATVFILFSLSCWPFSLNFGGVFEDRDPQLCTFGLSGCRVKPRRPPPDRAAGARTRQPENSKRAHLSAPALQTPPKFHEKDQKRGQKDKKKLWREREQKSAKFWAPTLRGPTLRAPTFSVFGPLPFGPPPFGPPHPSDTLRAPTLRAPTLRAPTLRAPTLRAPTLRPPPFRPPPFGPPPFGPPPFGPPLGLLA